MKPIAIIAIIAAVVVVGGACAGVAFSGVLNGSTTGPGGEGVTDPTGPTDPTVPIDPPLPPTDPPMSTFSPMTSSSSSSSSQPSTEPSVPTVTPNVCPDCEKEGWEDYEINEETDKHKKVCTFCDYEEAEEGCQFGDYTHSEENNLHSHSRTCSVCQNVDKEYCFSAEFKPDGTGQHSKFCDTCLEKIDTDTCQSTAGFVSNNDKTTHSKFCDDCGQVTDTGNCAGSYARNPGENTHSEICDDCGQVLGTESCTEETPISQNNGKHTINCDTCGGSGSTQIDCTYEYTSDNAGKHTKKCKDCGYTAGTDTTAETCETTRLVYTDDGKHNVMCEHCDYVKTSAVPCNITNTSNGDGSGSHKEVCSVCDGVVNDAVPCTFGTYDHVTATDAHNVKCDYCGGAQGAPVACTFKNHVSAGADKHTGTCACTNTKEEECTFGEYEYKADSADPLNIKKCNYCNNKEKQLVVATISVGGKTVGYLNVSDAVADAGDAEVSIVRAMDGVTIVAEDIAEGATATINPNGKKILLNYADVNDIKVKTGLSAESIINVYGDMKVNYTEPADAEPIVVDYVKNNTAMYIYTVDGLVKFAEEANSGNGFSGYTVTLMTNIDLTGVTWTPIKSFAGTFDGNGKTISNLSFAADSTEFTKGLFLNVISTGVVKNVTLENVSAELSGSAHTVGFLAGTIEGKAEYCVVKNAAIKTSSRLQTSGGMFGNAYVNAVIDHCSVDGLNIYSTSGDDDSVGGLVGNVHAKYGYTTGNGVTIKDSSAKNIIIHTTGKTKKFGGFVGTTEIAKLENCIASNVKITVDKTYQYVGGFIGTASNDSWFTNCDVNGAEINVANGGSNQAAGGFAGRIFVNANGIKDVFKNCDVTGLDITVSGSVGGGVAGFCGEGNGNGKVTIENCSVAGQIDKTSATISGNGIVDTLIGNKWGIKTDAITGNVIIIG